MTELQNGICINKAETSAGPFYSQQQDGDEGSERRSVAAPLHIFSQVSAPLSPPPPPYFSPSLDVVSFCGVRNFKPVARVDGKVTPPPPPSIPVAGVEGPGRRSGRSRASLSLLRKREAKRDSLRVATRVSTTKEKQNPQTN